MNASRNDMFALADQLNTESRILDSLIESRRQAQRARLMRENNRACHACGHVYCGTICNVCKEPRK